MAEYAKLIESLLGSIGPLLEFVGSSRFAERQGEPGISDFVFGNPHDGPLPEFTDALQRHIVPKRADWYAYQLNSPEACATVAASLASELEVPVEAKDVFLTAGAFAALPTALRTVVDPGDEVVYLSPPWFFYEAMITMLGATPIRVTIEPPEFELDPSAIERAITSRTRAIIVNSPHNPSGRIYGEDELARLAEVLRAASNRHGRRIFLLSDESYRRIRFAGHDFVSPAKAYADTFIIYTYGKTLLSPGQRLGYIALPQAMPGRDEIGLGMLVAQTTGGWVFPSALMQHALPDLEPLSIDLAALEQRRDRLIPALRDMGYDIPFEPQGTFYLLVRSPLEDDMAFCDVLADHDVFVLPGKVFELPGWFRISLTASDEMVERSLAGFEKALVSVR